MLSTATPNEDRSMPERGRRQIPPELAKGRLRDGHLVAKGVIADRNPARTTRDGPQLEWGPSLSALANGRSQTRVTGF